jgi:hypothetical protein
MGKPQKTLLDFQEHWVKLVGKAVANFNSLTPDERIWFTIKALISQVDNGGLISHYYNSGADYNKETIQDLNSLGFDDIANMLKQINKLFPNGQPSINLSERNDVISNWNDTAIDALLDTLDNKFYSREQEIENVLIRHIENKGLIK